MEIAFKYMKKSALKLFYNRIREHVLFMEWRFNWEFG